MLLENSWGKNSDHYWHASTPNPMFNGKISVKLRGVILPSYATNVEIK